MFKQVVIGSEFGVVAAAIQGKVDGVDYISHWIALSLLHPRLFTDGPAYRASVPSDHR